MHTHVHLYVWMWPNYCINRLRNPKNRNHKSCSCSISEIFYGNKKKIQKNMLAKRYKINWIECLLITKSYDSIHINQIYSWIAITCINSFWHWFSFWFWLFVCLNSVKTLIFTVICGIFQFSTISRFTGIENACWVRERVCRFSNVQCN